MQSSNHPVVRLAALCAFIVSVALIDASAHAQSPPTPAPPAQHITPSAKGIVGLGLIGAELGFVLPALAEVKDTWAYMVFPAIGAAGGGIAGYFLLERNQSNPGLAIASMLVGLALIIPTTIFTLSQTAYQPGDEEETNATPVAEPLPEFSQRSAPALLDVDARALAVHLPIPQVGGAFTPDELQLYKTTQHSEWRVPLLNATF